jgi:response regulator RpfG family c-di-GMP phosphodiesterase
MNTPASKPKVLLVDDDVRLLNACRRMLRKNVELVLACGAKEALEELSRTKDFTVVVCDQNMPGMKGHELLSHMARTWPHIVRVMLTGNADQDTAVKALNESKVFRFLNKPCEPSDILFAIQEAHNQALLLQQEKTLLEDTLCSSMRMMMGVIALANPRAGRVSELVHRYLKALTQDMRFKNAWELDVAASLWPLGEALMPDELKNLVASRNNLDNDQRDALEEVHETLRDMITAVPRLEGAADIVAYCRKDYDGKGFPFDNMKGEALPKGARLLRILIDCAEAMVDQPDLPVSSVLDDMKKQDSCYDPNMLDMICKFLPRKLNSMMGDDRYTALSLSIADLQEQDILINDLCLSNRDVLLKAGYALSLPLIQKIKTLHRRAALIEPVGVKRAKAVV